MEKGYTYPQSNTCEICHWWTGFRCEKQYSENDKIDKWLTNHCEGFEGEK